MCIDDGTMNILKGKRIIKKAFLNGKILVQSHNWTISDFIIQFFCEMSNKISCKALVGKSDLKNQNFFLKFESC